MSKKRRGTAEKIVMGAIIGTAIGSVIGLTVAPKKGKETRKDVKEVGKLAKETTIGMVSIIKKVLSKKERKHRSIKKETPKTHENSTKEIREETHEETHAN